MIRNDYSRQNEIEVVTIDQLVPEDHILRKVDRCFDFEFVRKRMEPLYCKDKGRPALDPVVLFKMMFIGYMFGIRSERQLIREIEVNFAYRWFLGMTLSEKVPDHSTISQNRRRRFDGNDVFRLIFDDIVLMAYEKGLIEGKTLFTDSTHIKANANKKKYTRQIVQKATSSYLEELEAAVQEDREEHDKPPLPPKKENNSGSEKEIKVSKTDADSGYMARTGKPEGFFYLEHRTTDGKHNMITDSYTTPGNIQDHQVYMDRLTFQINQFGFPVQMVGLDAGYHTAHICHRLVKMNIFAVISYRKLGGKKGLLRKRYFTYDTEHDHYICPEGAILRYQRTNRNGLRDYVSDPVQCSKCPYLMSCTTSKKHQKVIQRHIWEDSIEQVKANRKTELGEHIKQRRSETIERSFADSKELHGLRYARFRGLERVQNQCLMAAIVQNIKKMIHLGWGKSDHYGYDLFSVILAFLQVIYSAYMTIGRNTKQVILTDRFSQVFPVL
jgi:transposase